MVTPFCGRVDRRRRLVASAVGALFVYFNGTTTGGELCQPSVATTRPPAKVKAPKKETATP